MTSRKKNRKNKLKNKQNIQQASNIQQAKNIIVLPEIKMDDRFTDEIDKYFDNIKCKLKIEEKNELKKYAYEKYLYIKNKTKDINMFIMPKDQQLKLLFDMYVHLHFIRKNKVICLNDTLINKETHNLDIFLINFIRKISKILNLEKEFSLFVTDNFDEPMHKLLKKHNMNFFDYTDNKTIAYKMLNDMCDLDEPLMHTLGVDNLL